MYIILGARDPYFNLIAYLKTLSFNKCIYLLILGVKYYLTSFFNGLIRSIILRFKNLYKS